MIPYTIVSGFPHKTKTAIIRPSERSKTSQISQRYKDPPSCTAHVIRLMVYKSAPIPYGRSDPTHFAHF